MFGTLKLVINSIKSKINYNGWEILFDGEGSFFFIMNLLEFFLIFGVDNSSPTQTDNRKNILLILG